MLTSTYDLAHLYACPPHMNLLIKPGDADLARKIDAKQRKKLEMSGEGEEAACTSRLCPRHEINWRQKLRQCQHGGLPVQEAQREGERRRVARDRSLSMGCS